MSKQSSLSISFKEFDPSDYERLVGIYNASYPDYTMSIAERRSRDDALDRSKFLLRRFTCLDSEADKIVGFGEISHVTDMFHPKKFMANILVDPEQQGRGVGSAIYDRLIGELVNLKAIVTWTMVKEDLNQRAVFFQKRGFLEKTRNWESRLDLSRADPTAFRRYLERAKREGITFTTLAEEQRHGQDSLKKIHELVQLITADMPREAPLYTNILRAMGSSLATESPAHSRRLHDSKGWIKVCWHEQCPSERHGTSKPPSR